MKNASRTVNLSIHTLLEKSLSFSVVKRVVLIKKSHNMRFELASNAWGRFRNYKTTESINEEKGFLEISDGITLEKQFYIKTRLFKNSMVYCFIVSKV